MTYILQPSSKEMGSKVVTQKIEDDKEFKLLGLEDHDSKVNKPKDPTNKNHRLWARLVWWKGPRDKTMIDHQEPE